MKRSFDQFDTGSKLNQANGASSTLYNQTQKRRRMEQQRVGNFIVKVADALHFRVLDGEKVEVDADK